MNACRNFANGVKAKSRTMMSNAKPRPLVVAMSGEPITEKEVWGSLKQIGGSTTARPEEAHLLIVKPLVKPLGQAFNILPDEKRITA